MKKVAIRKLNRTQLKKEGTKEIYITGIILLEFFNYNNILELATKRTDPASKKKFYKKDEYYQSADPQPFYLSVTKENSEVRLTGFANYLPADCTETDYVVLEAIEDDSGNVVYLFDTIKNTHILVFQKYNAEDNASNWNFVCKADGKTEFVKKNELVNMPEDTYWLWDHNCDPDIYSKIIGTPVEAYIAFRRSVAKKVVRITPTESSFQKVLRAQSSSKRTLITQDKALFIFEEQTAAGWEPLASLPTDYLEVSFENSHIVISNHETNSFTCYGGK